MLKSDNHNHIIYEKIQSMIGAARTSGFDSVSITEHISQFKKPRASIKFHSVHRNGRMFSNFEEYLGEFKKIRDDSIKVNLGLEVDYISTFEKEIASYVNERKWDVVLVSVHELKGGVDIESNFSAQDRESCIKRWHEYIELQKQALQSKFTEFDILTHPVRLARSTPITPDNFEELLIDLAIFAKNHGKCLELNGNDITRNYDLVERLAFACATANCEVSFGSDAHHPNEVGRGFERATELMTRFNLKPKAKETS
jgi:histidinol-phosphatase (PHP family)